MNVTSGVDWFDLAGTLDFDGLEVQLPEILEALRRGQNYVRLSDGSRGLLPQDWLARFATMAEPGRGARAKRSASAPAQAFCSMPCWRPRSRSPSTPLSPGCGRTCGASTASAAVDEPPGFCGQLRHYQKAGLGWLDFLQEFRLGGCLADDMGLGKTVQVLAMLQQRALRPVGRRRPPPALAGRRAPQPRLQLDRRGQTLHARTARAGLHGHPAPPADRERSINTTW